MPAALHGRGLLHALVTDIWLPPDRLWTRALRAAGPRLACRYSAELGGASVFADTIPSVFSRSVARLPPKRATWPGLMADNLRFDHFAAARLENIRKPRGGDGVALCYSYAASRTLRAARSRGFAAILNQIDGGPQEARLISALAEGEASRAECAPPEAYWRNWRDECRSADMILVNSSWSRDCLVAAGIAHEKLAIVPLMYRPEEPSAQRRYPERFDADHPLVALFLGAFSLRKGARTVLEAAAALRGQPVEFLIVGRDELGAGAQKDYCNIRFVGEVSRGETASYYRKAHVFVLPTHSDGFALTQLEAQAHGLPAIVSSRCGDVVLDGASGIVLPEVSAQALRDAILWALRHPERLGPMAARAISRAADFDPTAVIDQLREVGREAIRRRRHDSGAGA
ncbi:glycosyltransferase family 4 protein [Methylosinus sp. H3A]|uniref:glycosyltransferase family 4 protein n=1 Tax=Methylosinus sp. H3A TaxID=2785786 RepID=UPI0018C2D128|nr:glycosyltransferase family 4 protein [Methylosinus sp. H3A]MBG0811728.1 glycosyltransferase family 4 protein [Methylosinus sp. H3A]